MRFDVITLFPGLIEPHLVLGVTRRAFQSGRITVKVWQLREFADNAYRRVDDRPYGGGPGMVMLVEPLQRALDAVRADRTDAVPAPLVHFTPTGRRIDQALVREWADGPGGILLCGRYESVDQRFVERHVDVELSLGDFVLSGGELPALALLDGVARLQEGVLGDAQSHRQDSFENGLLDCPHFSRPEIWDAGGEPRRVPAPLMSGDHGRIARWRRDRSLELTLHRRPDLIDKARDAGLLNAQDEHVLAGTPRGL